MSLRSVERGREFFDSPFTDFRKIFRERRGVFRSRVVPRGIPERVCRLPLSVNRARNHFGLWRAPLPTGRNVPNR